MMDWCISSLGCSDRDLGGIVDVADHWDVPLIELRGMSGSLDAVEGISCAWASSPSLCERLCSDSRIRVIGTSFHLLDHASEEPDGLIQCAVLADSLRCPWLRVFGRRGDPGPLSENDLCRLRRVFDWWDREKRLRGIACDILVETHDVFSSAKNVGGLMLCRPSVAVLLDVEHVWHWWDVGEAWNVLRKNVVHVHVKDARWDAGRMANALPGHGDVPVITLLSQLAKDGYEGAVSLEWERHWDRRLPDIEVALAAMHRAGWR